MKEEGVLPFSFTFQPFTCDQLLENPCVGYEFITYIVTDVGKFSVKFSRGKPFIHFRKVKGGYVFISQHGFNHVKERRFTVILFPGQHERLSKFISPIETIPDHFFKQAANLRVFTTYRVKHIVNDFAFGFRVIVPINAVQDDMFGGMRFEFITHNVINTVPECY
ncbi:hypothetical protein SDC9_195007 [bioreactor metagenome]|uniref:Uncharacterized protein n=1 Tax=bioreactor metagenome TaxID=1076179 RepID=A0A645I7U3_9ZZZZ